MQKTLIGSGSLIALFDKSDSYHIKVLNFLKSYKGTLVTSLAVVTEVSHMLDFNLQVQIDFDVFSHNYSVLTIHLNHFATPLLNYKFSF